MRVLETRNLQTLGCYNRPLEGIGVQDLVDLALKMGLETENNGALTICVMP